MKRFRQMISAVFTVLAFCFLFANVITVNAADYVPGEVYVDGYYDVKENYKSSTKKRVVVGLTNTITVRHGEGDTVKKIKINKKNGMTAAVTNVQINGASDSYSTISFYTTKTGTYKLTITVTDATGKVKATKKLTVQVVANDSLIKKATFGNQVVKENSTTMSNGVKKITSKTNTKVKGTSGKLKITPNSQYKITGIIVAYVNDKGELVYKKIKNGGNVTLSKTYYYTQKSASGYGSRSEKKYTYIYISYKDKFYGNTVKYSVTTKRGRKEIKCVEVNKITGDKSVSYTKSSYSNLSLWQY
ncbi:MAG: hypothetical protein IJP29_04255 [Lachnospiraceae bacterium]|nr:hypothetical protein [Lachnospiraceae bacterium]